MGRRTRRVLAVGAAALLLAVGALALAIAFGGPERPAALDAVSAPFRGLDLSGLPPLARFTARDGSVLAYRRYAPEKPWRGSVVLVHGSSARSDSVHPLAAGLARAGYTAYALDVRGHGESGAHGHIAYVGQLEDDLDDFARTVQPPSPCTLMGFSSGGGFTLRFAADRRQALFDRYVLLAPFLGIDAPTYRAQGGGWVGVGVPRIVALTALNRLGITAFNTLPVLSFALDARARAVLTADYSYMLWANFGPHRDWRANLRAARQPLQALAGRDDELFIADRYEAAFAESGRSVPVTLLPGIGHMGLTLQPAAVSAVAAALAASVPAGQPPYR